MIGSEFDEGLGEAAGFSENGELLVIVIVWPQLRQGPDWPTKRSSTSVTFPQ